MHRIQWFELEDLPWMPRVIRDGGTDVLDAGFDRIGFYDGVVPAFLEQLAVTGVSRVVDLGSGGGGGVLQLRKAARAAGSSVEFVLSDRFPNAAGIARVRALGDPRTQYRETPIDAANGPIDATALYTMCGALHHFPPERVRMLIARLVEHRVPLGFFDVAASPLLRRLPALLAPVAMGANILGLAAATLAITPLVRPVTASRLLLTYLVPAIPALVAWDGAVSAFRAYTADDVLALARSAPGAAAYHWTSGTGGPALFLCGRPRSAA
jgi:SAM-dependent methyltransferase